jgi:hypothetical protein
LLVEVAKSDTCLADVIVFLEDEKTLALDQRQLFPVIVPGSE